MDSIDQRIDRLKRRNIELANETIWLIRANQLQLESIRRNDLLNAEPCRKLHK